MSAAENVNRIEHLLVCEHPVFTWSARSKAQLEQAYFSAFHGGAAAPHPVHYQTERGASAKP
ncbi:MAG: hypothetical protein AAFZ06_10035, partial [Pseudomonadota bacterium]